MKNDSIVFVSAGGLIPRKDPLWLINFWVKNFGDKLKYQLLVLGAGPLLNQCKEIASRSENINILGKVDEIYDFYEYADFFISTSHAEGLPNAVLEALSVGNTCILSSIEPHKEINKKMTHGVHLYELNSEYALRKLILNFDLSKIQKSRVSIALEASEKFSALHMVKKYEELYQNILDFAD